MGQAETAVVRVWETGGWGRRTGRVAPTGPIGRAFPRTLDTRWGLFYAGGMNANEPLEELSEKFSNSSRVLIQVDRDICAGFGECVTLLPQVFALDEDGLAVVLDPEAAEVDQLIEAADICPVSAILLFDENENQIAPEI